jgi:hypothetical protein
MSEICDGKGIKAIAYYLPQFHAIPENDKWWGEGFTEWTNTRKANPLYEGHRQPKTPLNKNYYNLLNDDVKIWQADLAKRYGLFGFCYYHYWFKDGKKLLEKPVEQMLLNKQVNIPFCLSWANENWTRNWDGGNREIIMEQDYGSEKEWEIHFQYLLQYFKDERYITYKGKPVFIIYKPYLIPCLKEMLVYWNKRIREYGFSGICFAIQDSGWYFQPSYDDSVFDFQIKFEPFFTETLLVKNMKKVDLLKHCYKAAKKIKCEKLVNYLMKSVKNIKDSRRNSSLVKKDYDRVWRGIVASKPARKMIPGGFVDWDNTARNVNGTVYTGGSPQKFGTYMKQIGERALNEYDTAMIFINAWNEWAEGAYLEPDTDYEFSYLEALKNALD